MITVIVEAVGTGGNWGKFLVARFAQEWQRRSEVSRVHFEARTDDEPSLDVPLLFQTGWRPDHVMVFDLQTGEGALFKPGGFATADLEKRRIWVCPLFEPFLAWLYEQDLEDLDALPRVIKLDHGLELHGRRRPGRGETNDAR